MKGINITYKLTTNYNLIVFMRYAFIKLYSQDFELGYVDYLGINIPSVLDGELTFKIYYINKVSRQVSHPLINFLEEKGMIRYVTMVRDKKNRSRARYDVGLKNRLD